MRKIVLSLFLLLLVGQLSAAKHMVTGRVANRDNGELLEMAALRLFSYTNGDSLLITGAQTNQNGEFALEANIGHAQGKYALIVSMLGYKEKKVEVVFSRREVNMKTISIEEETQELGVVEVRGTAAEMVVRGDTVEYNASAYKMNENAVVEDLLKKMSGVEVSSDGKVTINGEEIKGVRIDGKKFFGSDVQTATKNIPVEMIDKIQVIDQKSDMAKMTGIEDDETERIINLTLKSNRKKGMFGNFNGGLGADAVPVGERWLARDDIRYNAGAFLNLMLGESQTTILAGANNTNEARSGRGRGWMGGGNRSGITRAENLGVNTNVALSDRWTFGGDASMNHTNNNTLSDSRKTQFSEDKTYQNNDSSSSNSVGWDATMRLEFEFAADTLNTLLLKPNLSYRRTETNKDNYFRNMTALDTIDDVVRFDTLSNGLQTNWSLSNEIDASLQAIYTHKFASKLGRSISVDVKGGLTQSKSDGLNTAVGSIAAVDQKQQRTSTNGNYSAKVTYIEPLAEMKHFLELSAQVSQSIRQSEKNQYNKDANDEYTLLDSTFTNSFRTNFLSESVEANYRYRDSKVDLSAGIRINPSQTWSSTHYLGGAGFDTLRSVWNFAPKFNFKYKFGKKEFARIIYRGQTNQPSITQMAPVRDNSNVMSETVGNLGLNPAFSHQLRAFYTRYNADRLSSINVGVFGNLTKDALVNNTLYDETGKAYRQTVNAKGLPFDVTGNLMYNTPVVKNRLHFFTRTELGYNRRLAYVRSEVKADLIDLDNLMLGDESRTDNLRAKEELSLRITHDVFDFGVRGNFTYSRTNNNRVRNVTNTFDWGVTADFVVRLPKQWTISTDIGYNDRKGYNLSGSLREILWNASVDKSFAFGGTLSLKAFDMLNQRKNVVETISDNTISYARYNALPTYVMLSFTYRLNKMGDLKAKGAAGFMQQMNENGGKLPMAGGMPPMGPPPGR